MARAAHAVGARRAMLAWELGDGLGHVGRLLPIARRLAADGVEPVFVLRDAVLAGRRPRALGFRVLQAPIPTPRGRRRTPFFARSFADILTLVGYEDPQHLADLVAAWRAILDLVEPAIVVCDFSPTLALASIGGAAPLLQVGSGFALPPSDGDGFPVVNPAGTAIADLERLSAAIRAVVPPGTACEPGDLPRLLGGDWQAACTWPLIDPYRAHRRSPAIGPLDAMPAPRPVLHGRGWYAYVAADAPQAAAVIDGLLRSRVRGAAYVRHADDGVRRAFAAAGHVLHDTPPALESALATTAVVVHHGGINTTETALALGVPQLIVSRHLEQHLTGAAIAATRAGLCLRGKLAPEQVTAALHEIMRDAGAASRAARLARSLPDRGGAVDTVVGAALSRLPASLPGAA